MRERTVDPNPAIPAESDWKPTLFDLEEFEPRDGNYKTPLTKIKRKSIATDQIVLRKTLTNGPVSDLNRTVR